jgi:hypothetical protein
MRLLRQECVVLTLLVVFGDARAARMHTIVLKLAKRRNGMMDTERPVEHLVKLKQEII